MSIRDQDHADGRPDRIGDADFDRANGPGHAPDADASYDKLRKPMEGAEGKDECDLGP